ncbi:hypothetical protein LTR51_008663 [Lithohypha guttulata]|nr:hypothetical protein LTR51_008663 [Lithohypha guttulata]
MLALWPCLIYLTSAVAVVSVRDTSSLPLYGPTGASLLEVKQSLTPAAWFEITVTGILLNDQRFLTRNVTDLNDTHASVSLWAPSSSATAPDLVTVQVVKRPWSILTRNAWPAALYDAFHQVYAESLQPNDMTEGDATTLNASLLYHAIYGQSLMRQCDDSVGKRPLLVQHNAPQGPVPEVITRTLVDDGSTAHVHEVEQQVVVNYDVGAAWWNDCLFVVSMLE